MKDPSLELSRHYLNRAGVSIDEAKRCLQRLDYALCVLRSAESVEFSLKAALLAIGEAHRLEHDISGDLYRAYPRFPEAFRQKVPRFALISRTLTLLSLPAKYGDQKLAAPPSQVFDSSEAKAYLEIAQEVLNGYESVYFRRTMGTGT